MNKEKVWQNKFGNREEAYDFAGRKIKRSAYGNFDSQFCWNIHHILPESKGGTYVMPVHCETNEEAADKTSFWANGALFEVVKDKATKEYKIRQKN
ncbi:MULTISPECIES: hypothetical protein [unclassified Mycoplasma]|uniref:hypothetical protein n=1 Tax=unclassified Mycoplasma TaxID=2683645 RepID=UPI00211C8102|nr:MULTISPECIES: hypothetical protein [unclassified Mycoplasma]UUM20130.1 hypothetical protein NPA11_01755 [Mycoplasma sp. 1578d]UUM25110.1 hypothetical protein NPA12_01730 [Mycoplasma sp. 3686d]